MSYLFWLCELVIVTVVVAWAADKFEVESLR